MRGAEALGTPVLRTRRIGACAALVAALALLGACSVPRSPLMVEVRDAATGEPAAGVTVLADVPSRNHPFSVASLLGRTGDIATSAGTDAAGRARLEYVAGRPVRLGVLQTGWDPGLVLFEPDAPGFDTGVWLSAGVPPIGRSRRPEFRVVR